MVLQVQCWLDSSADYAVLSLAGYIAPASKWVKFAAKWQDVLDMDTPPFERIANFKMGEMDLKYPPHLARCEMLYRVIEEHVDASVSATVIKADLESAVDKFLFPSYVKTKRLRNPYFLAFTGVFDTLIKSWQHGDERLEFLFDTQGELDRCRSAWKTIEALPQHPAHRITKGSPVSRRDDEFPPIQAADLFAFWVRKWESEGRGFEGLSDLAYPWSITRKIPRYFIRFAEPDITANLEQMFSV